MSVTDRVELSERLVYFPCKRFGNFDKLSVSVGCGSLNVTGGSQAIKLIKIINIDVNIGLRNPANNDINKNNKKT